MKTALVAPPAQIGKVFENLFLGDDADDASGPVRSVQEFQVERTRTDTILLAALFATYLLIVIVILDLVRLALLLRQPREL